MRPLIRIHNAETDLVTDREMNDQEFAQYKASQVAFAAEQTEAKVKATEKAALLAKLGITADEAKLLLS